MSSSKLFRKLRSIALVSTSASCLFASYCFYKNDETFFKNFLMPIMRLVPAEEAHEIAVAACRLKILPSVDLKDPESLVILKVILN
jgi:dihydroorotate dehydrogenase